MQESNQVGSEPSSGDPTTSLGSLSRVLSLSWEGSSFSCSDGTSHILKSAPGLRKQSEITQQHSPEGHREAFIH